jgi:cell division protein FtsB
MAEFIDQRKQVANQQQQHQSSSQDKKDLFKNVPDLVEEKRKDLEGNYNTINKYAKGIVLGKVCFKRPIS